VTEALAHANNLPRVALGSTAAGIQTCDLLIVFLFNRPIFPEITLGYVGPQRSPVKNLWRLLVQDLYRPDALPVTQPTVSEH